MNVVKEVRPSGVKTCRLCANKTAIDYKDAELLKKYLNEQGKILARTITGCCAEHQKEITLAVKRSREIGLISR